MREIEIKRRGEYKSEKGKIEAINGKGVNERG